MRKSILAFAFVALGGCSTVGTVLGTKVPAKSVYVAANAFDAAEATGTTYLRYCTPKVQPAGCSNAAIQQMIPAIRAGRTARNNAEAAVTAANGDAIDASLYTALTTATGTLTQIEAQYNVGSK